MTHPENSINQTPAIDRTTARRLAEHLETSPEIFLAISAVLETMDEERIVTEWEEGMLEAEVITVARRLRADLEMPLFWGGIGRVA